MNTSAQDDDRSDDLGDGASGVASDRIDLVLHALSSRPRRDILRLLVESANASSCCGVHDACSCDFAEKLGLSPATVSYHMKVLVESGVVSSVKRGLWVYYGIVPEAFDPVRSEIRTWSRTTNSE